MPFGTDDLWPTCLVLVTSRKRDHCTPSVKGVGWLHGWYNHTALVVPPLTALAFVTKMRNLNLHHLMPSKWKTGRRQSVLKKD